MGFRHEDSSQQRSPNATHQRDGFATALLKIKRKDIYNSLDAKFGKQLRSKGCTAWFTPKPMVDWNL